MRNTPVSHRQIETRAGNKSSHPGNIAKPPKRRTTTEVEADRATKARAKQDRELARKQRIERAARFERADRIREDDVDDTPQKALPGTNSLPSETSDVEMTEMTQLTHAGNIHYNVDGSITVDDSAVESDPPRPLKKAKASSTAEGKGKVSKKATRKAASKKKTTETSEGEVVGPGAVPPKEPKPKKKTYREEINLTKANEEALAKELGALFKLM
jgi:hypothetical protein